MSHGERFERRESLPNPEDYKELVGRLTVFRHGQTAYTGQYPDLSEKGKNTLFAAGQEMKKRVDEDSEDLVFFHSPAPRAKGSMGHLLHGMNLIPDTEEETVEGIARPIAPLRPVKKIDPAAAQQMMNRHIGSDNPTAEQYEGFDRVYATNDEFEHSPHWEPRSAAPKRANRMLRFAIEALVRNHTEKETTKTPHAVVVAHFETISDLAAKIFNLDWKNDELFARGEHFTFEVRGKPTDDERVLLVCTFRGEKRNAWFDLEKGEIAAE